MTPAAAAEVLRMKGLLHVAGSDRQHVLQAVGQLYEVTPGARWRPDGGERASKVVVIGKGLQAELLQAQIAACQA